MITISLKKPITAHGEELTEIHLRKPEVVDITELGRPLLMIPSSDGATGGAEIREKLIVKWIIRLAAIPESSVKSLHVEDYIKLSDAVAVFFMNGAGETIPSAS